MKRDFDFEYNYPQKKMRPGDECIRLLIPSKVAGSIIGKGGKNITDLRGKYKASITVPDCPGPERILTITSDQETGLNIVADILPNLLENGSKVGDEEIDVRLVVHQSQAGSIIGKGGSKIKELREIGGKVKLFTSPAPRSTDRICQLVGKPSVIVELVREILDLLRDAPPKGPIQNYDPHNFDEFFSNEYGGFGGRGDDRGGRGGHGGPPSMGGMRGSGGPPPASLMQQYGGPPPQRSGPGMGGMAGGPTDGMGPFMGGVRNGGPGDMPPYNPHNTQDDMWPDSGPMGGGGFAGGPVGGPVGGPPMGGGGVGGMPMGGGGGVGGGAGGGMGVGGNIPGGMPGAKTSTQVTIPKELAGAVIGKGGSRIKKIRMDSCAAITIDEPVAGSNDRVITITGYPNEIQMAQYLLQQNVQAEMQTRRYKK